MRRIGEQIESAGIDLIYDSDDRVEHVRHECVIAKPNRIKAHVSQRTQGQILGKVVFTFSPSSEKKNG